MGSKCMWMRSSIGGWIFSLLLPGVCGTAAAHDVPPSIVMIDIGRSTLDVEAQLQLSELGAALGLPLASSPDKVIAEHGPRIEKYVQDRLQVRSRDGRAYALRSESLQMRHTTNSNWTSNDWLIVHTRLQAPDGASTEVFGLDYSVILERVVSHTALVYVRRDIRNELLGDQPLAIGLMGFGNTHLNVDGSGGNWWRGLSHLFSLGMQHIATGSDHLLFLIALLLPAPLLPRARQWGASKSVRDTSRTIVGVVSGFTLGHSLTLALAASGLVAVPGRPVEILIALSVLVSSIHAWKPLFPGREVWVASAFGLVHGLAFAEVLSGLNFDAPSLVLSLIGFNLGIETMQLLVIAVILPLMLVLALTRYYTAIRTAGAGCAAACALGWILERAFQLNNPLAPAMNWLAPPPGWVIASVCVAGGASICVLYQRRRGHRTASA